MDFVKFFLLGRLLPRKLQNFYWNYFVPSRCVSVAGTTALDVLSAEGQEGKPNIPIKDSKLKALLSSMWIDTGARPDKATFMLTASVFRGWL